jgi:hypothetical protein
MEDHDLDVIQSRRRRNRSVVEDHESTMIELEKLRNGGDSASHFGKGEHHDAVADLVAVQERHHLGYLSTRQVTHQMSHLVVCSVE